MLSVVLYGRNDNHGYNLHKRGAISLNAIAHLMRDEDDELIFVDYNTPDDLPTFPEAIADTLTEEARARLRILRVRPAQHARFAGRTHLNALEPIARNVAIRRSNPANRWVLSTNTDMIFVPRKDGASLNDLFRDLDDGFYHLPRFELPEALWESLDRQDSAGIIRSAGHWGERFHLDEVVRSGSDNLFDGPGDFQLFLRQDLFAIGGFDEAMLKGWHVDANVARRMRMLRGEVRSAEALLRGYHCDHTRQASPYHKGDRIENDPVRFVDQLERAELGTQLDRFGLAGETVEEVRLRRGTSARYLAGLDAAVPKGRSGPLETAYVADAFGHLEYPLEHVLPYLFDLVSCIPEDSRIGYLGARPDTFEAFIRGWRAMGGTRAPLLPAEATWLTGEAAPLAQWAKEADVFVFEIGAEQAHEQKDLSAEERARLWLVNQGLNAAFTADAERQRQGAPARRAIVVNAIHNSFEAQLFRHLSITLTPFSSRIRHGFIVDPERRAPAHPTHWKAAKAVGREQPFSPAELARAAELARGLAAGEAPSAAARAMAGWILALAEAGAPELPNAAEPALAAALKRLADGRAPTQAFPTGLSTDAGRAAASRVVRREDWSDPAFLRMAYALFPNRRHVDPAHQTAWTWERTALALNLDAAQPLAGRPTVLVAAGLPELLAFMLSNLGARVDIADPLALVEGRLEAVDWREDLIANTFAVPASAEPLALIDDRAAEIAGGLRYDAVLLPQNALFARGRNEAARLLREASALLRPGGHLGVAPMALVNDVEPIFFGDNLTADLMRDGRLAQLLAEGAGLRAPGGLDAALTPGTADTLPPEGEAEGDIPSLLARDGPALRAPSVFSLILDETPPADDSGWQAIDDAIRTGVIGRGGAEVASGGLAPSEFQRLMRLGAETAKVAAKGSILRQLEVGEGVTKTPRAVRVAADAPAGIALHAALGRLEPGDYDLRLQGASPVEAAVLQVFVLGRDGLAAEAEASFTGEPEFVLPFTAPGPTAGPVTIAIKTLGGAEIEILDLILD